MSKRSLFSRIKKGARDLTPLQQLRAKRVGVIGQCFGLCLGMVVLVYSGFYYWIVFLGFTFFVMLVELVGINQQVKRIEG